MTIYRDAAGPMRRGAAQARQDMPVEETGQHNTAWHESGEPSYERGGHAAPVRTLPRTPRSAPPGGQPPAPGRRSASARHPIIVIGNAVFTLLVLLALAAGGLFLLAKRSLETPGPLEAEKIVNIPPKLGIRDIADLLRKEGVVDRPWTFVLGAMVAKAHDDLKFGEYQFAREASLHEVIDTLIDGKVVQHQITVPEGLTSEQIVQRLMETDILAGTVKEIPLEGSMLPESYRYTRGAPRDQMIQRMQQAQARVVQEVWGRRSADLPLRTPQQLVILASIVERETGRADERSRVAAVFANRLRQHMKLQSDPTIIYGLVGGKATLNREILRSEIDQHTPYNTYVIEGLPPGPISNPGRAALEAVANPARTKELYFVADGTGGHTFSETLEQHQRAVARLRQLQQGQRDAAGQPQGQPQGATPAPAGRAAPRPAPQPLSQPSSH